MFTCHEQLFALSFFNWGESVKPNPWLKGYKKKKAVLLCDLWLICPSLEDLAQETCIICSRDKQKDNQWR